MIILIIHIIVSYDQNLSLIFFWKMDPISGFDRSETVHCSTNDAYTPEITFHALLPWLTVSARIFLRNIVEEEQFVIKCGHKSCVNIDWEFKFKKCSRCLLRRYCSSPSCQKLDWVIHKKKLLLRTGVENTDGSGSGIRSRIWKRIGSIITIYLEFLYPDPPNPEK